MHQWRGILSSPVNNIDYVSLLRTKNISRQRKITDYSVARILGTFLLTVTNDPGHQAHGSGVFQVHDEMRLVLTIYARAASKTVFHLSDKVSGCQLVTALTNRAHCTFNEKWNSKLEKRSRSSCLNELQNQIRVKSGSRCEICIWRVI